MPTTLQQLYFQAGKNPTMPIREFTFEPTFGIPTLPNRKIPLDHPASHYNQLLASRPNIENLRKSYAMVVKSAIGYSMNMDEATKNNDFLDICSWEQIMRYTENDFEEWEREMALEEEVWCQRMTLDDSSFSRWVENHDQCQFEYKLLVNKRVIYNLNVENFKETQDQMARDYREHIKLAEAEDKRKNFDSTIKARKAQIESANQKKQLVKVDEQKRPSKTMKPRTESTNSTKTQEAKLPRSDSEGSDSRKARSNEDIRQEFLEKARLAATNNAPSKSASPLVAAFPLATIAPSIPALGGSPTSAGAFTPSPSPEISQDSVSSGPASSRSLSTPCTTPPSTQEVSSPNARSSIVTLSKSPAELTSSALAMPAQAPGFVTTPLRSRDSLPPLRPARTEGLPQHALSAQFREPRRRHTPPEWSEPVTLCSLLVGKLPYTPVKSSEAMMPPTEAILMLGHTSVIRTLASAMNIHPSLLLLEQPHPAQQSNFARPDLKEVEYLILGLRVWWSAIYPKPPTTEEKFAMLKDRACFEEPLREAFEMATKREVKFMAWRVWRLVRERGPLVRFNDNAGETVRQWLGWEKGELGFWD